MTSKTCSEAKFFTFSLRRQTGITLLGTAFSFLVCPGTVLQQIGSMTENGYFNLTSQITTLGILVFLIALMVGVVLQCFHHGYLFSKKSADLYCALPLRRDALMGIDYVASLVGAFFSLTVSFAGLAAVNSLNSVNGIAFCELAKLYGLCLLLLLLCMSTVQIFVVNAGTVFNFVFSTLVVCVGLPVLCLIGYSWYSAAAFGTISNFDWMQYVSPFAFSFLKLFAQYAALDEGRVAVELSTVLIALGGSVVFSAIAFAMHHFRKAERAGSGFAYFVVPVIIAVLASVMGGYLVGLIFGGGYSMDFWFYALIGAALAAVASGTIISKSFVKVWRWFVCAALALAVLLGTYLVSTDLGEREKYDVPDESEIASILLGDVDGMDLDVTLTKNFDLVTKLHEYAIATEDGKTGTDRFDYTYSTMISSHFHVTYTLKNGETLERWYWIRGEKALQMKFEIMQTEEYTQAWLDAMEEKFDSAYLSFRLNDKDSYALVPFEEAKTFFEVYARELQNAAPETVIDTNWWTVSLETSNVLNDTIAEYAYQYLYLPESFTETHRLAEELIAKYDATPTEESDDLPSTEAE